MLMNFFGFKHTISSFKELLSNKSLEVEEIKDALKNGLEINAIDEHGDTFLHYAIKHHFLKAAKALVESGIDVDIKDNNNNTPIYLSVEKSYKTIIQAIVQTKRVDLSQLKDNRSLLQDAILQGNKEIVNIFLKTNINKNHIDAHGRNIMFDAIANGNERLIDNILDVEDLKLNVVDNNGETILHEKNVIENDKLAIKLIKKGADPTILDTNQKSYLLHVALRGMETEAIIDAALESGVNINSSVRNKNSILMEIMFSFARLSEDESDRRDDLMAMASKLVKKGVNVSATNDKGETVLFNAARKHDIQACSFLLKEDTPVNIKNNKGNTVLSELVFNGIKSLDIIYLLLKYGADASHKNKTNQTISEIVNELILYVHGNIETINIPDDKINSNGQYMRLLEVILEISSFNVNTISSEGEPLFFKSLLFGNRPLFELYCKHGININTVNSRGNSIFSRYVGKMSSLESLPKDFRDVVIMLLDKKININYQDETGKTVLSKLISSHNMDAFRILFAVTRFNFFLQDNHGYTIIHDCVSTANVNFVKLVDQIVPKLKNIPDNIGILPITYAAIFAEQELVLKLIDLKSDFTSGIRIPKLVKQKFIPLLKNLDELKSENKDVSYKLNILKDQIRRDFQ